MIIVDFNGIAVGNIITQKLDIQEELIRHMILNTLRMYNKKFRDKYGQMVIACDSSSWRKEYYPQYKYKRKVSREESSMDWGQVFDIINTVKTEISENLPYRVIQVQSAEADDIIGALCMESQEFGKNEPIMIVSADKDFIQLHKYDNVRQFSPMTKKFIENENPRRYLFEHICKGDSGDGIPNCLMGDDTFVNGDRQSPVTKKKIQTWLENAEDLQSAMDSETYRNYIRNKKLVDLSEMPDALKADIINTYDCTKPVHKMKVLNYLIKKRCKMLIECVEEFY